MSVSPSPVSAPPLADFVAAARQGAGVWVRRTDAGLQVQSGAAAGADAVEALPLLLAALEASGCEDDAIALALREAGPALAQAGLLLPSAPLLMAVGTAESMSTLSDARGQMLKLEWSATLLGRRFVALCTEMGLDAAAMPPGQRQALDEAVRRQGGFLPPELALRQLLQRSVLQ